MSGEVILVVDDEPNIIQLTKLFLESEGYIVKSVEDGQAALQAVDRYRPKLMILDIMLPLINGFDICRQLRAKDNPEAILILNARDEDVDRILGLELGADDYLTKPFNPRELVARVKAIIRREEHINRTTSALIKVRDLVIYPASREITVIGEPIHLSAQEFDLLYTLMMHRGLVLSREQLIQKAWGYEYYGKTRTVDVHVGHLR